jgi:sugar lactone lactonase YvrE
MVQPRYISIISMLLILTGITAGCKKEDGFKHNPDAAIVIDRFLPAKGIVGTEVLVYGSNFSNNKEEVAVTLNGMPCELVGVNENNLLFRVPSKAGSGVINISIAGKTGTSSTSFEYVWQKKVSTFAGNGTQGFIDRQYGTDAAFYFYDRTGITADATGNLYIADCGNHCIRKIDTAGYVTTFSGYGHGIGYFDGPPATAKYNLPTDIDIDKNGYLYVADRWNWFVRKIGPDGSVTSFAAIADPAGIGVDKASGNVYVASPSMGKVYQVTPVGVITEVPEAFNYPSDVAVDDQGNVLVVDQGTHTIEKLVAGTWNKTTIAGTTGVIGFTDGATGSSSFNNPVGITINNGNIYIADYFNNSIRTISGADSYTFLGTSDASYVDGDAAIARFNNPGSIAFGKNGAMYVLDRGNGRIRKVTIE